MDNRTVGDVINQMPVKMKNRLYLVLGMVQDESTTISAVGAGLAYLVGPLTEESTGGPDADVYLKTIAYVVKEVMRENCSDERREALLQDELIRTVVDMVKDKEE